MSETLTALHDPHYPWPWMKVQRPLEAYYFLRSLINGRIRVVRGPELEDINRGEPRYEQLPYVVSATCKSHARRVYFWHIWRENKESD